ncbi:unnamed protein product [[Actinomadura] parvosata subsp. kistnae]|uniref:Uncharacterized protein n=1 Tax=[Actinomadura] parvosata subsp. kistnae TaxID=1909395 RepID=A0A1V0AAM4_9ACTN|nr:hypothetical protein [Nonomuraea sp. ATCC 55076]AQZ67223.1 hypothetical protein BKM31_42385 [Nonomuraea sp. ATCC 55076]SPL94559.1 unnamed protein product [Actinomadura parvosata subsp. kistnae]
MNFTPPSRRAFLSAAAALPLAAVAPWAGPRKRLTTSPRAVCWTMSPDAAAGGAWTLRGYEPSGRVTGEIPGLSSDVRRSADGSRILHPWSRRGGAALVTVVGVYDAGDGRPLGTVTGAPIPVDDAPLAWDDVEVRFSADGRRAAVLHRVNRQWNPPAGKQADSAGFRHTCAVSLEMIDLSAGRSADLIELEPAQEVVPAARALVRLSADGARVHVFDRGTVIAVAFDGKRLSRGGPGRAGLTAGTVPVPGGAMLWYGGGEVHWATPDDPGVVRKHRFARPSAHAFFGRRLALADPVGGTVELLDAASGRSAGIRSLRGGAAAGNARGNPGATDGALAFGADGSSLWMVDGLAEPGGLWRLPASGAGGARHLLAGTPLTEVRAAPDAVFALSAAQGRLHVLSPSGTAGSAIETPGALRLLRDDD